MAALVATKRQLWVNLSGIKEKDKSLLLDALLSPSGLFRGLVNSDVERFQEAKQQSAAFQRFNPHCYQGAAPAINIELLPQTAAEALLLEPSLKEPGGSKQHPCPKPPKEKTDLRNVILAKKALGEGS